MDDAKKLSEDVSKSTGEFMALFTGIYIASTVGNKLKDHIINTVSKSYGDASAIKNEKVENKIDEDNKQEQEQEAVSDKKGKEAEAEAEAEAESDQKIEENKEMEAAKDDSKEAEPDKKVDNKVEENKENEKPKEIAKAEAESDQKVDIKIDAKEDEDSKEKGKDIEPKPKAKPKPEAAAESDQKVNTKVEDTKEEQLEPKMDEKEKEKEKEEENAVADDIKVADDAFEHKAALVKAAEGTKLEFPMVCCSVMSYTKQLMDGGGNEYNAFNILYYKLSVNEANPSRFGIKVSRYSRIRDYHEAITKNIKVKNLKFPSKSLAFWKKNDDQFLDSRQQELDKYFVQSTENELIATNDIFCIFLGLSQDVKNRNKIKVFTSSLASTCNGMNYVRLPTNCELNRFDTEQDMLLFSIMIDVNDKTKDDVAEIISKQAEKLKNTLQNRINKLMASTVQKVVNVSWIEIEKAKKIINTQLDDILANKTAAFDAAMSDLMGKIKPIIGKKLNKKADGKEEEEKDDEKEKKVEELKIADTKSLNEFVSNLGEEKEKEKAFAAYTEKSCSVLIEKEGKDVIAKYLFEIFDFSLGKYIKSILAKRYDKYAENMHLICGAMARLIQVSFELMSSNSLLIFSAMDNERKGREDIIGLLQKMGENIGNVVADLDAEISAELGSMSPSTSSLIVEQVSVVSGIIGNLLCCVVNDYYQAVDLGESVTNHLNKYLVIFCECILESVYKSVLSVLLDEVKKEIKEDVDKVVGGKLEFDFIPDSLPKTIPNDILEKMMDVIIGKLLQKNMKKKKNELNSKLYQIIRSN